MSENKSENAITPEAEAAEMAQQGAPPASNAWVAFERGQMSRRHALKKLGLTSAMATLGLFSVDDLARKVGKAMEQRARDNKIVDLVSREFQSAGIAIADGVAGCVPSSASCANCVNGYENTRDAAENAYTTCLQLYGSSTYCKQSTQECQKLNDAYAALLHCICHCAGMGITVRYDLC